MLRILLQNFIHDAKITVLHHRNFYLPSGPIIKTTCDGTYVSGDTIISPNYPQENNVGYLSTQYLDCRWSITDPAGSNVTLTFLEFHTDEDDILFIYHGSNILGKIYATRNGYHDQPFSFTGNAFYLRFKNGAYSSRRGFKIKIHSTG